MIYSVDALLSKAVPKLYAGSNICHIHSRRLAQERHSAARTRIDLYDEYIVVRIGYELYIEKPYDTYLEPQPYRVVDDFILYFLRYGECGVYRNAIARMNARTLHVLHYTGDKHVATVADGIYFEFFARDIFIHQNRLIDIDFYRRLQIFFETLLVVYYLHSTSAKHETRTNEYGITNILSHPTAVRYISDGQSFRLRDTERIHNLLETVAVLGSVYRFYVGADYLYPEFV